MLYSCTLFHNEFELLKIRLEEISLVDDNVTHILVESNKTHTGLDKPLYFEQHAKEFYKYNIMYYVVDDMPDNVTARERETHQRNAMMKALKFNEPKDDDIILISDVDEIPRARTINLFKPQMEFAALIMDKYAFFLNCIESEQSWDRARVMTWRYLKDKTPEEVRNSGYDFSAHHAGWHYSWVEDPLRKLQSFSHQELNTPQNIERLERKENIWNDDKLTMIDINLSHPEYLYKNQSKFKHLIK